MSTAVYQLFRCLIAFKCQFRRFAIVLAIVCFSAPSAATEERISSSKVNDSLQDTTPQNLEIYLLLGQSNMAGRGKLLLSDKQPVEGVWMLDAEARWRPAAHPLHFDKPHLAGVGLGIDFALTLRNKCPDVKIGLVPCAMGGSSLNEWQKGAALYEQALRRARVAMEAGKICGILWHQGESDCEPQQAETYASRLSELISNLRSDLNAPGLPFVLGELGEFRTGRKPLNETVIAEQHKVVSIAKGVACVSAHKLKHNGDFTHFDGPSLHIFGRRYAEAMYRLQHTVPSVIASPTAVTPFRRDMYHEGWVDFNKNGECDLFEDRHASMEKRIEDLLGKMTLNEKTCQLATLYGYQRVLKDDLPTERWKAEIWRDGIANIDEHINGIPEWRGMKESKYVWPPSNHARALNEVQRWFIEETRLGIPVDFSNEGIRGLCHHRATNFPAQIGVGATWDRKLVAEIGRVTGREARALGYTNIYSPILDLARDPRWGRVVECYGEDPYLVSELGIAQAAAIQECGVAATAKHYAVYSVPKGGRDGEARTDPHIARREMEMMYLMPFAAAIRETDLLGVMSSYNDYDAVPVSASHELLIDQLRNRMGFKGYVVSDSGAVKFLKEKHRVVGTFSDAARLYVESGGNVCTDFSPPDEFIRAIRKSVESKTMAISTLDDRVRDVLRVKFYLGLFDDPYVADPLAADRIVHSEEHQEVALRAARESIVLLKNNDDLLPLSKNLKSILVCGPNAKEVGHSICRYGPTMSEVVSVYDGIKAAVSAGTDVRFALGAHIVDKRWPESELYNEPPSGDDAALIQDAVKQAQGVDAIIVVLGESELTIGESKSRTDLNLTGYQNELVRALYQTGRPIVVVLLNGRALTINWIDRHVPTIVDAWFPGEFCGRAISNVLFGDYNPGGKLPVTFPKTVGQVPYNFPFKPFSHAGPGKGHNPNGIGDSQVVGELYPFGHGLSYTTFKYDSLSVDPSTIGPDESVRVRINVTNTGSRAGEEVVQLYVRDEQSSIVTYDTVLRGFERIRLEPRETRTVEFMLGPRDLELLNEQMRRVVEPGRFDVLVGSSSRDIRAESVFEVISRSQQK